MSDQFQYPSADDEAFDPASFIIQRQRQGQFAALNGLDANPEDAAQAQDLSHATGTPPALVYGDLENFQQQHKAALTAELLKNNQFLAQYAESHPLAAKISNDDWGQLDAVSQALLKFKSSRLGQILDLPSSTFSAAAKGFKEGFGSEPPGQWISPDPNLNRLAWSELAAIGYPLEMAGRVFSGVVEAAHQAATQAQIAAGADPNVAEQRAREMASLVEAEMGGLTGRHVPMEVAEPIIKKVGEVGRVAKPFLDEGVEVPVGVHPDTDLLHREQAKSDVKALDEVFKEAQASATKERSPEIFANFIRQHTDASIGIDAEAVRKLYGDKVPEADDNLLGWVPGIQDKLALAEAHGGDVEVPLADWVAKADPEVAKELHDFIRVRPGGMTLEETKTERAEPIETKESKLEPIVEEREKGHIFIKTPEETEYDLLSLREEPDSLRVGIATVAGERRGQGIGISLYEKAMELAGQKGKPLRSDMAVTPDAIRMYEGLKRRQAPLLRRRPRDAGD